jgi:hypothetical protein
VSPAQIVAVNVLSAAVILGMFALCMRSRPAGGAAAGPREYRVHGAWYVFSAVGGAFLVGIFAVASRLADPADKASAAWCSAASAAFFVLFTAFLRSLRVTLDGDRVTSRTFLGEKSVALRDVERVSVTGLVVEVRLRADPSTGKRPRPLTFLAGLRGLGELTETIRARSGASRPAR